MKVPSPWSEVRSPATPNALHRLSPAQRRILLLIGQGKMTKEIAADLGISEKGVEYHRARIYSLLNLHSVGEAVAFAIANANSQ